MKIETSNDEYQPPKSGLLLLQCCSWIVFHESQDLDTINDPGLEMTSPDASWSLLSRHDLVKNKTPTQSGAQVSRFSKTFM